MLRVPHRFTLFGKPGPWRDTRAEAVRDGVAAGEIVWSKRDGVYYQRPGVVIEETRHRCG